MSMGERRGARPCSFHSFGGGAVWKRRIDSLLASVYNKVNES
jgi:hypothetical protein